MSMGSGMSQQLSTAAPLYIDGGKRGSGCGAARGSHHPVVGGGAGRNDADTAPVAVAPVRHGGGCSRRCGTAHVAALARPHSDSGGGGVRAHHHSPPAAAAALTGRCCCRVKKSHMACLARKNDALPPAGQVPGASLRPSEVFSLCM